MVRLDKAGDPIWPKRRVKARLTSRAPCKACGVRHKPGGPAEQRCHANAQMDRYLDGASVVCANCGSKTLKQSPWCDHCGSRHSPIEAQTKQGES